MPVKPPIFVTLEVERATDPVLLRLTVAVSGTHREIRETVIIDQSKPPESAARSLRELADLVEKSGQEVAFQTESGLERERRMHEFAGRVQTRLAIGMVATAALVLWLVFW